MQNTKCPIYNHDFINGKSTCAFCKRNVCSYFKCSHGIWELNLITICTECENNETVIKGVNSLIYDHKKNYDKYKQGLEELQATLTREKKFYKEESEGGEECMSCSRYYYKKMYNCFLCYNINCPDCITPEFYEVKICYKCYKNNHDNVIENTKGGLELLWNIRKEYIKYEKLNLDKFINTLNVVYQ